LTLITYAAEKSHFLTDGLICNICPTSSDYSGGNLQPGDWLIDCWLVSASHIRIHKPKKREPTSSERRYNSSAHKPDSLSEIEEVHLVLDMFIYARALVIYVRTAFKPRCCLYFQGGFRMCTQAEPTDIALNMFCRSRWIPGHTLPYGPLHRVTYANGYNLKCKAIHLSNKALCIATGLHAFLNL
jgi:hypothetical protein